jgi:hypothetical protein
VGIRPSAIIVKNALPEHRERCLSPPGRHTSPPGAPAG